MSPLEILAIAMLGATIVGLVRAAVEHVPHFEDTARAH